MSVFDDLYLACAAVICYDEPDPAVEGEPVTEGDPTRPLDLPKSSRRSSMKFSLPNAASKSPS
jgi:hypothetical protein